MCVYVSLCARTNAHVHILPCVKNILTCMWKIHVFLQQYIVRVNGHNSKFHLTPTVLCSHICTTKSMYMHPCLISVCTCTCVYYLCSDCSWYIDDEIHYYNPRSSLCCGGWVCEGVWLAVDYNFWPCILLYAYNHIDEWRGCIRWSSLKGSICKPL